MNIFSSGLTVEFFGGRLDGARLKGVARVTTEIFIISGYDVPLFSVPPAYGAPAQRHLVGRYARTEGPAPERGGIRFAWTGWLAEAPKPTKKPIEKPKPEGEAA